MNGVEARNGAGRRRKRVTLQQVADAAGVSRSAASFAMTGRDDQRIAKATVERVRRVARELGYRPNQTAKTLRTGMSGTIGLISDFIGTTSRANAMVRGAMEALQQQGMLLFTVDTQGDAVAERKAIRSLVDRQVDGIIYASMFTREVELPESLDGVPLALLNCMDPKRSDVPSVIPDECSAGYHAAAMLIEAGHRDRIVFAGVFPEGVTGGSNWHFWKPWALQQRLSGIERALGEVGGRLLGHLDSDAWEVESGRRLACELMETESPSAVICVNDAVAFGMAQVFRDRGVRVPEDISMVGFDGSEWSEVSEPRLATIGLPHVDMGRLAVSLLLEGDASGVHMVDMPVVRGESVASPAV